MNSTILELQDFSKYFRSYWTFRPIEAVRRVSLQVYRGESFGFIGHNGAGKTTTIKSIVGLLAPTGGRILLDGQRLVNASQRRFLGYLPEQPYFYDHLSVEETLLFFAALCGMSAHEQKHRTDELLELVGLAARRRAPVRTLSKGLQQRLGFAQAILNKPKLLLLDEPFSGLDPQGRIEIRNLILKLKQQGTTIFLSSHILSDVEHICERVAIMVRGELKTLFSLKDVGRLFGGSYELTVKGLRTGSSAADYLSEICREKSNFRTLGEDCAIFRFDNYQSAIEGLLKVVSTGASVYQFRTVGKTLEEIFISTTAGEAGEIENSGV